MTIRTSTTLAFALSDEGIVGYNFLQKLAFYGSADLLEHLGSNVSRGQSLTTLPVDNGLCVKLGAMVSEASAQAVLEQEYNEKWLWGLPAALFHFSVQGNEFESLEQGEEKQRASAEKRGFPDLYMDNSQFQKTVALQSVADGTEQLKLMARRRSDREAANAAVPLVSVASILFSGMGITQSTRNAVAELPLSITPSGGARNPYEAYILARKVDGLEPGIYHYSAIDHTLGRLAAELPERLSQIVGDQDWADDMSCIVVLAAFFERTMWKYDDPNAYRVVLIEAGHIGQNMLLTAAEEGLAACPTAALSHQMLFEALELPSRITCAPIYAIALGVPGTASEDGS
jgi:SagB-type dehydrogenase family enzyme